MQWLGTLDCYSIYKADLRFSVHRLVLAVGVSLFVVVGLFLEVSGIRRPIDFGTHRAFVLFHDGESLMGADEAGGLSFGISILGLGREINLQLWGLNRE